MRITQIIGTHMDLTDAIRAHVQKRISKLEKFTQGFEPCDISVDVGKTTGAKQKGRIFRAEFNLTIPGTMLRAEEVEEDLYAAIDKVTENLTRQIKQYKEKIKG